MGILEHYLVRGNSTEAEVISRFGVLQTKKQIDLNEREAQVLKLFLKGYYMVQKLEEFIGYKDLPYWKILRLIPPVPSVVNAATLSERIGREIIDETLDYEYILRVGGEVSKKGIRNLGNLLSGFLSKVEDGKISNDRYNEINSRLNMIISNWGKNSQNTIS